MTDLYLVDASVYVFRAFFAVDGGDMRDRDGNPCQAVYGFGGFLCTLLEQTRPSHIAVAFDESLDSSFRNDIYPAYKANREKPPIELKRQFSHCRAIAEALGIDCFSDDRYEADDLIGTLLGQHRPKGARGHIVSADKDLGQLLAVAGDNLWDFSRNLRYDHAGIKEKFGVRPDQMADYLALAGDSVDNIPGIPGVGPKTAAALLGHFDTLDDLLQRSGEIEFLSIRGAKSLAKKVTEHAELAELSKRLSVIATDAPIPPPPPTLQWRKPDLEAIDELFDYLNFGRLLRERIGKLAAAHSG